MNRPTVHASGRRLYYADQVKYAQGERIVTPEGAHGTITGVPLAVCSPCYYVRLDEKEEIEIMAEADLTPE